MRRIRGFVKVMFRAVGLGLCFVLSFIVVTQFFAGGSGVHRWSDFRNHRFSRSVTMLAFGDVNLGRVVGQKILEGGIDFPFQSISVRPGSADIVFANLESQLSDQAGETQDPVHNMIFTGPPTGAMALVSFGITHVSTANNHAFDYGADALFETLDHLDDANIGHTGTGRSAETLYEPLVFERNGIRFALFAVTDLMNFKNGWHEYVAVTDTGKLFPAIRMAAASVDAVILSFHGGEEYQSEPTKRVKEFAEACVRQGVKVFLGHHPHVPYGVERINGNYIFHSLGNFVFYQPQLFWTQLSFAVELHFEKDDSSTTISTIECIPLRAGYQPSILTDSSQTDQLQKRLQLLSNIPITLTTKGSLQ